jgi:hypothetical protein
MNRIGMDIYGCNKDKDGDDHSITHFKPPFFNVPMIAKIGFIIVPKIRFAVKMQVSDGS